MENEYIQAVNWDGNIKAQKIMQAFVDGEWRGLGKLPSSAFKFKMQYAILMLVKNLAYMLSKEGICYPDANVTL